MFDHRPRGPITNELAHAADDDFDRLAHADSVRRIGRVVDAYGTIVRVTGLPVRIGQLCHLYDPSSDTRLAAEVIGVSSKGAMLQPFGHLRGLSSGARVEAAGASDDIAVGTGLLGRIVNANGEIIDGRGMPDLEHLVPVRRRPPPAMRRAPIETVVDTGISAIDSLLTCGKGQRICIMAPAGAGKSTLLGMLAAKSTADVNVVALIGERGREVREFVENGLAECRARSVVVVATSDEPSLLRARAAYTATAIAEHFRDHGLHVALFADSLTRYARALRDVGLAMGEASTRSGFPPSVFSELPQLLERTGTSENGAITAFYTLLVESNDAFDPIAEETNSIVDGHIALSRKLAMQGHYPPIDILASVSRLMNSLVDVEHRKSAERARDLLARYESLELLIQMGEYKAGNDAQADAAVAAFPKLRQHLRQDIREHRSYTESLASLRDAIGEESC